VRFHQAEGSRDETKIPTGKTRGRDDVCRVLQTSFVSLQNRPPDRRVKV
jgi:hypothetical protein